MRTTPVVVTTRLTAAEAARLDRARRGFSRSAYIRLLVQRSCPALTGVGSEQDQTRKDT